MQKTLRELMEFEELMAARDQKEKFNRSRARKIRRELRRLTV
jgi:hypothetical protein